MGVGPSRLPAVTTKARGLLRPSAAISCGQDTRGTELPGLLRMGLSCNLLARVGHVHSLSLGEPPAGRGEEAMGDVGGLPTLHPVKLLSA